jgi:hypothetical protein
MRHTHLRPLRPRTTFVSEVTPVTPPTRRKMGLPSPSATAVVCEHGIRSRALDILPG